MVTNTVPLQGNAKLCDKIEVVDISPTLAGRLVLFFFVFLDGVGFGEIADGGVL